MRHTLLLGFTLWATAALGGEAVTVFVSEEDPATPPDAAFCATAPFFNNVKLGASLWSVKTSKKNGRVTSLRKQIGRATACLGITNPLFPQGLTQKMLVRFDLPAGSYTAEGTCVVASNSVPEPFLILAGCTLRLTSAPAGTLGGLATSNSVLNPLKRPGYATGSTWTLHEYLAEVVGQKDDDDGENE